MKKLFLILFALALAWPAWGSTNVFVDITGYTHALIPKGHGKIVALTESTEIYTRYPSYNQTMQMAAFFNSTSGLLVYSTDPVGEVADWAYLAAPLNLLRITFYGTEPTVVSTAIAPTVQAAADGYKAWAMLQTWVSEAQSRSGSMGYNLFALASTPDFSTQLTKLQSLDTAFSGTMAAWMTQYRLHDFDTYYPDYTPSNVSNFQSFLTSLKTANIAAFPYMNALLFDTDYNDFDATGEAVAKRDAVDAMIPYSGSLPTLFYACPYSSTWRTTIVNARDSLVDAESVITPGIYLDVAMAYPHICMSATHGHDAGDPYAHQSGLKTMLSLIDGKRLVEGMAEIYMGEVDGALMHLYTDETNNVPLWYMVYENLVPTLGWIIAADATAAKTDQLMKMAESFGQQSHGTPNLTHLVQEDFLEAGFSCALSGHFNAYTRRNGTGGTVTLANTTFNFTAGSASVDFAEIGTLTPYVGYKLTITDSAGKKLIGYIKKPLYNVNAAVDRTTAVAIVSQDDGATYNWASEESGFDRTDANGFTYEIVYAGKKPLIVPFPEQKRLELIDTGCYVASTGGPSSGDGLLLESGTYFLILETGDYLLLE